MSKLHNPILCIHTIYGDYGQPYLSQSSKFCVWYTIDYMIDCGQAGCLAIDLLCRRLFLPLHYTCISMTTQSTMLIDFKAKAISCAPIIGTLLSFDLVSHHSNFLIALFNWYLTTAHGDLP